MILETVDILACGRNPLLPFERKERKYIYWTAHTS
jgi:hypothetical protein